MIPWFPVTSCLPRVDELVLASVGGAAVVAAQMDANGLWWHYDQPVGGPIESVTDWQKWPEPVPAVDS
jgi:hypothetical protein